MFPWSLLRAERSLHLPSFRTHNLLGTSYDVFKRKDIPTDEFREWFKFYEQVEKEDYDL